MNDDCRVCNHPLLLEEGCEWPEDGPICYGCLADERDKAIERSAIFEQAVEWQPIETAPKDGRTIIVRSAAYDMDTGPNGTFHHPPKAALARWDREGTSWVSTGLIADNETIELQVTGIWLSGGGWFQPDEVTHWAAIPAIAVKAKKDAEEVW